MDRTTNQHAKYMRIKLKVNPFILEIQVLLKIELMFKYRLYWNRQFLLLVHAYLLIKNEVHTKN